MGGYSLTQWATAGAAFLTVAFTTISLVLGLQWWRARRSVRGAIEQLRSLSNEPLSEGAETPGVFRASARVSGLEAWAATIPRLGDLQRYIEQSRTGSTLESILVTSLGLAVALGIGTLTLTGNPLFAVIAATVAGIAPMLRIMRRRAQVFSAFETQLPEAIDLLGRAIRAGHPVNSGFKMVADESPEPLATDFRRVFEEQRFGMPLDDSLMGVGDRVPLVDVRILVAAILIQREVGGNLAEILDNLSHVIRERFSIRRQIRTYTAQGRMTGYLLGALPIALFFLLFLLNREFMIPMLKEPLGQMMLGGAVALQLVGFLWIRKIVDIDI